MRKHDLTDGYPGHCARCGAVPGQHCIDYEKNREIYYCIRDCFDTNCQNFWYNGRLYLPSAKPEGYSDTTCTLESALQTYKSLWEWTGNHKKWYQWYRGRWQDHQYLTWFSIYPCPFPIKMPIYTCNLKTRGIEYWDISNEPRQLSLF